MTDDASGVKPCGCEQRGPRLFMCAYHRGYEDGQDALGAALLNTAAVIAGAKAFPGGLVFDAAKRIIEAALRATETKEGT